MEIVYHGSKESGLKRLEPRKSTHGTHVYATPEKVLALHFSKRCGDDLVYDIGHFSVEKDGPWELIENVPGAFDKMYSNSSSIYTLPKETFKDLHTGFCEIVSEVSVDVISEEYCNNVWEGILKAEKEGLIKIYRYPNKPTGFKHDGSDILDKWRRYKNVFKKEFTRNDFNRLIYLHPNLMQKVNELAEEFGYDYRYEPNDLINLFQERIEKQLRNLECEQYIDCSYISICESYQELISQIDELYKYYKQAVNELSSNQKLK